MIEDDCGRKLSDDEFDKSEQFGFVQFHPSYDYTDFVEGLRPTRPDSDGKIGFELRAGIFKGFCAAAMGYPLDSKKKTEELAEGRGLEVRSADGRSTEEHRAEECSTEELSIGEKVRRFLVNAEANGQRFETEKGRVFTVQYNSSGTVDLDWVNRDQGAEHGDFRIEMLEKALKYDKDVKTTQI